MYNMAFEMSIDLANESHSVARGRAHLHRTSAELGEERQRLG